MSQSLRPLLFAAFLSVSGFTACQKSSVEPESTSSPSIVGRWELTQTSGGISGGTRLANPAQRSELEFDANGQVQELLNGVPTTTATYTPTQRISFATHRNETFLGPLGTAFGSVFIYNISNTKLELSQDGNDGITSTYQRK